jgi:capsule polysaccharide modification protein KpsS
LLPNPAIQENQDKEQHRRATTSHRKAIPKEQEWGYQEESIEGYDDDGHVVLKCYNDEGACCTYFRDALRHRFTSPGVHMAEWMSIQQNNTQYCVNQRTMIANAALIYNEGNGGFASKPNATYSS